MSAAEIDPTTIDPTTTHHSVEPGTVGRPRATTEKIDLVFLATWRRRPARVEMQASRHVYPGQRVWSGWHVVARDAWGSDAGGTARQDRLTATARSRLGQQFHHAVVAWLDSPAYAASERHAYADVLTRMARKLSAAGDPSSRALRRAIAANADKLAAGDLERLIAAADAYDRFVTILGPGVDAGPFGRPRGHAAPPLGPAVLAEIAERAAADPGGPR